ncbi:MAG: cadmium-translocating P-type ATPase [Clostridia bacterium]|nr:cadmium-translocating P-type ATPase [Clostridia bacterium]
MKKTYKLQNLDCAHCAQKMEDAIQKIEGVKFAAVNFAAQKITLEASDDIFDKVLKKALKQVSKIEPDCTVLVGAKSKDKGLKTELIRVVISALLFVLAFIFDKNLFFVAYIIIGYDVLYSAVRSVFRGQVLDEKFLMSVASIGAFAIGEYAEAVAVMLFYQIGEYFQGVAVGKSRKSIASLMDIRPDYAVVLRDGRETEVSPEDVEVGEIIIVKPGERIPLDGVVTDGITSVDTSALTGESMPVSTAVGDRVYGGSINLNGVIFVKTESTYAESTVSKILDLVENSAEKKSVTENFITRFARYYTPCVVISALLLALLPPILFSLSWSIWIKRALVFLVVSCPCALVVSVPLSYFGGIGRASRDGILIKGANYLEALSGIDTLVLDKTGTITKGNFAVTEICADNEQLLLETAALAESCSSHPVAKSIVTAYGKEIDKSRVSVVTEIAGKGVRANVDGRICHVGSMSLMESAGVEVSSCNDTAVYVARDGKYLGYIIIKDEIKPDSAMALKEVKNLGVDKTVILTGDNTAVAQSVADAVCADEVYAKLLPQDKVEKVEELISQGRKVAFVGDGINDAPVLSRADVGIAMGALGSDAAIESADIVFMDDSLAKLPLAIKLSARTMRIVRQNIIFSLSVKAVILILGAFGIANMWTAVFGDVGVMVIAILNAMRAMIKKS